MSPPGRHSVQYRAGVLPFGVVTVTIPDVAEADVTNYTLTVDNGVGEPLNKNFSLYLDPGGWVTDITLLFFLYFSTNNVQHIMMCVCVCLCVVIFQYAICE